MRFVISHIKNEEYLLKWWLRHHKEKFDHGVIVDYGSTDKSLDLIREITPTWDIFRSRNNTFTALGVDQEIFDIETQIQKQFYRSWVITLNVTEFLIGNTEKLKELVPFRTQKLIAGDVMVDTNEQMFTEPDPNLPLIQQRRNGVPLEFSDETSIDPHKSKLEILSRQEKIIYSNRLMRSLHNYNLDYTESSMWGQGRHFWGTPCEDFKILWYGYSPYTEDLINRQLAIQKSIPNEEFNNGRGIQHKLSREDSLKRFYFHQRNSTDLSNMIERLEKR